MSDKLITTLYEQSPFDTKPISATLIYGTLLMTSKK